jgi:glycosyltransferase involved in cell wall biosynthesis
VTLSVVVITHNEEATIGRTLGSVEGLVRALDGEIIVVDSGSTDRTVEITRSFGAKVFIEEWKGFAAQKNSAIAKASGDWVLSLDADEEVSAELSAEISRVVSDTGASSREWCKTPEPPLSLPDDAIRNVRDRVPDAFYLPRKNFFLGRWIRHGGYWPERKLRLFRRGTARFQDRLVHEDAQTAGATCSLGGALIHHSYPTLSDYIEHMNRYSSLGAQMVLQRRPHGFSLVNIVLRPLATFIYNYVFRLGFLDGREGLLLHLYHAVYVSWKYAKAWESGRRSSA